MNALTDLYQIGGVPMIAPDAGMELSFEDIDSAEAGRDESGVMHRLPVRKRVGKWGFHYTCLTAGEYAYLLGLMPQEGDFQFTYPDPASPGATKTCTAYLSGHSLLWQDTRTGLCRDVKFNIIEV